MSFEMELWHLQVVLLVFIPLLLLLFFKYFKNGGRGRSTKSSADLKSYPLTVILRELIKNRHRILDWITETLVHSPSHTITIKGIGMIVTANSANVEHVSKTKFANYGKGDLTKDTLQDFLGDGISNCDGEDWKWQRKVSSYEFSKRSLRNFVVEIVQHEIDHRLLPFLKNAAEKEETVDLQDVFERFGFDTICKLAFSEDPACLREEAMSNTSEATKFMKAFDDAQNLALGRFIELSPLVWKIKRLLNIGSERKFKKSISIVHSYAMKIIQARKGKPSDEYHDLLSRFASIKDASQVFLIDVIIGFLLAGRETTSSALVWFFWILSRRPDVREKIILEIKGIRAINKINTTTFGYDDLRDMHYLHAAMTESMRLFPPVIAEGVSCLNDDTLPDGTVVRKGWLVMYLAYSMGRMEDIWGIDCNEYKPERWLEKGLFKPESQFRYLVFNAGPRICLGKDLAYIQMKSIIASILEQFEIPLSDKDMVPLKIFSMTMKMKGGLPVRVKKVQDH